MRKLILEIQTSVDGFIADTNGSTEWMVWNWGAEWTWDEELRNYHTQLTKQVDCILLSRQMAEEGFNVHWQKVTETPSDPRYEFAKHATEIRKVVFTKTLDKSFPIPGGWTKTDIAEGDFVDVIKRLKKQSRPQSGGNDIMVYGGATFVSSLIKAKLIDEFHLLVNPVAIGNGLPIFNLIARQALTLIRSKSFSCGVVLLHYELKKG
ncbi:MAG: dihydrofolate reductase family protein [Bacteroidetes bacterium]|nr:dihydrofolate reductase family protein [Bacteroidota bacterium]